MNSGIAWLKKYFIPHYENNYKPHFLRRRATVLVFLVVILVQLTFLVQVFVVFDKTTFLASVLPGVLTTLTNEERAENDAPPLKINDLLSRAAQLKADDMAANGYFAHTSPDGKTPWYWLDAVGYDYKMAGENLAVNFFESDDVAKAWMESPTHRDNIVKKGYTEIGIGVASGTYEGQKTVFVAQLFGTPVAQAETPKTFVMPTLPVKTNTINTTTVSVQPEPKVNTLPKTVTPKAAPATKPKTSIKTAEVAPTATKVLREETSTPAGNGNTFIFGGIKSFIEKVLASPRQYVTYIYSGIALIMILALLLTIFIKREFQHPMMIGRGVAVLTVIIVLLFINIKIFHQDTKVPTEGLSASVIAY
ncbi:MAG TPA: CAP domain-containing protein [Candidatus Paceibacterota bacterium]|jgi:hypothetical protein|nr:CAP domain-containing protein [Candidatus Paceibacterota bacterium]